MNNPDPGPRCIVCRTACRLAVTPSDAAGDLRTLIEHAWALGFCGGLQAAAGKALDICPAHLLRLRDLMPEHGLRLDTLDQVH